MDKPLEQWEQVALLQVAEVSLQKVRDSLGDGPPAALTQKLNVARQKIVAARTFIEGGWIRCPKCKRVSYNKTDIEEKYCANCSMFHDQFDPIVTGD